MRVMGSEIVPAGIHAFFLLISEWRKLEDFLGPLGHCRSVNGVFVVSGVVW